MKKILLISKEWSPSNKTGLGFASKQHEEIFKSLDFQVITVSSNCQSKNFNLQLNGFIDFIFDPWHYLKKGQNIIELTLPDIIIVESMQTVVSEIFLYLAKKNKIKKIIISHGISIFPYTNSIKYFFRFFIWAAYLPFLYYFLKSADYFFSLDIKSKNLRHFDKNLFLNIKKKKSI